MSNSVFEFMAVAGGNRLREQDIRHSIQALALDPAANNKKPIIFKSLRLSPIKGMASVRGDLTSGCGVADVEARQHYEEGPRA